MDRLIVFFRTYDRCANESGSIDSMSWRAYHDMPADEKKDTVGELFGSESSTDLRIFVFELKRYKVAWRHFSQNLCIERLRCNRLLFCGGKILDFVN